MQVDKAIIRDAGFRTASAEGKLAVLVVVFVAVWTAYGTVSGASGAIHNDMAEAYAWGREFQLGYEKHPPFWAWIAGLWFEVLPRADWAFVLLAVCNAALGLYGSWTLIGDFAEGDKRLAATALLLLTSYYTFLALKYNANSIFLSLWPWTMHFLVRSIDDRRLADAILFGLFIGMALLSKYSRWSWPRPASSHLSCIRHGAPISPPQLLTSLCLSLPWSLRLMLGGS